MPYRTIQVKAPLFMRHKGVKVYRIFMHDDADGDIRQYSFTFDPIGGGDDHNDGIINFDVRDLTTWPKPSPASGADEEKAIKRAIRTALDKGEIGPPPAEDHR